MRDKGEGKAWVMRVKVKRGVIKVKVKRGVMRVIDCWRNLATWLYNVTKLVTFPIR